MERPCRIVQVDESHMLLTDGERLALGQWQIRATTRTAAATATEHCPESLEGRVEAWRRLDAATGRSEKVKNPVPPNRETCQLCNRLHVRRTHRHASHGHQTCQHRAHERLVPPSSVLLAQNHVNKPHHIIATLIHAALRCLSLACSHHCA